MIKRTTTAEPAMTLEEIARMTGTSKSTVSRVMSNDPRISDRTRTRVQEMIVRHGYRPNRFARALAGGRTGLVGVISSNIGSGFYAEVIRGIDLVFRRLGNRLLVSFARTADEYTELWHDLAEGGQVEGLVVLAPTSDLFSCALDAQRTPTVLCVGTPPRHASPWRAVDQVGMDNMGAMAQVVEGLVERGARRLVHAAGRPDNSDAIERRNAFGRACRRLGVEGRVEWTGITQADGYRAMADRLSHRTRHPDAIVCFNDSVAIGLLEAWHVNAGADTPLPFALTGWDDSPAAAALGLTSVHVPFLELGETAAQTLASRRDDPAAGPHRQRIALTIHHRASSVVPHPRSRRPT